MPGAVIIPMKSINYPIFISEQLRSISGQQHGRVVACRTKHLEGGFARKIHDRPLATPGRAACVLVDWIVLPRGWASDLKSHILIFIAHRRLSEGPGSILSGPRGGGWTMCTSRSV